MGDNPKRLKDLRVADLKQELEKRGLQISGIKAVLADRLKTALVENGLDPEEYDFNSENATDEAENNQEERVDDEDNNEENPDDEENFEEKGDCSEEVNEDIKESVGEQDDKEKIDDGEEVKMKRDKFDVEKDVGKSDGEDSTLKGEEEKDASSVTKTDEKEPDEDSLNIMVGDEDNLFEEEERINGAPSSPPRPENAPVKHPFTSNDTISLHSRVEKPPSENSSMRVNPDESQSVASHDSGDGIPNEGDKNGTEKNKENDTDELSNIRNLWISGLSSNTKAADLKAVFSAYGKVSGAKIMTNSRAAGARCFGYVSMSNPQEADTCIQKLNRSELGGRLIVVEKATGETRPTQDGTRRSSTTRASSSRRDDLKKEDGDRNHSRHENRRSTSHTRRSNDSHLRGGRSNDLKDNHTFASRDARRGESSRHDRRDDRRHNAPILTLNQIKDQRNREQQREEDRRRRERERRRQDEEERRRKDALRRQQEAEEKLRQEREELKRERERLEKEKKEIMELERERQRAERRKLERDKADLEKLKRQSIASNRQDDRRATKRLVDDRDSYASDRDRKRERMSGREDFSSQSSHGSFQRRPEERSNITSRYDRSARDLNLGPSRGGVSESREFSSQRSDPSTSRDFQPPRGFSSSASSGQRDGGSRNVDSRDYRSRDTSRMGGSMSSGSNIRDMTARDRDGGGRMSGRDAGSSRAVEREVVHRESGGRVDRRDGGDNRHERGSGARMDIGGQANYRGGNNSGRSSSAHMQSYGGTNSRSAGSHHHMPSGRGEQHMSGGGSSWSTKGGNGGYVGSSSSSGGMSDYSRGAGNSGMIPPAGGSGGQRGGAMSLPSGISMPFQALAAQLPMIAALGHGGGIVPMNDNNRYDGYSSTNKSMMNHQQRRGY